jgi:hypothetical protein
MFSTDTYGAFGCLKHNRLYHKERGEWVQFTHLQMTAIRAIYTYCNLAFIVQQTQCDACRKGPSCSSAISLAISDAPGARTA